MKYDQFVSHLRSGNVAGVRRGLIRGVEEFVGSNAVPDVGVDVGYNRVNFLQKEPDLEDILVNEKFENKEIICSIVRGCIESLKNRAAVGAAEVASVDKNGKQDIKESKTVQLDEENEKVEKKVKTLGIAPSPFKTEKPNPKIISLAPIKECDEEMKFIFGK